MYDKELVLEILDQIKKASNTILDRFKPIKTIAHYTDSSEGMEKLDAVCMLLIAIGESIKKLDRITNSSLLSKYDQQSSGFDKFSRSCN